VESINRFWCGDITYVPTEEGWLYLSTVQDLFSRRVLGWAMEGRCCRIVTSTAGVIVFSV
jgi:transposase InsO family protein